MTFRKAVSVLLCAALAFTASATLLVVDEDGLGLDFATIGAAIDMAEKGDTIIVTKKHSGDWHEDLVIEKGITLITQDLTIKNYGTISIDTKDTVIIDSLTNIGNLTYTDGTGSGALLISDLMLTGTVTYTAAGTNGVMQISNSSISSISTAAATGAGNVVRVLSSSTGNVTTGVNYSLELYNSQSLLVSYADGDVIGNNVKAITVTSGGSTNKTKIIGNYIYGLNSSNSAVSYLPLAKDMDVLNNKFGGAGSKTYYSRTDNYNSSSYSYTKTQYTYYRCNGVTTMVSSKSISVSGYGHWYDTTWSVTGAVNSETITLDAGNYTGVATIEHNFFNSTNYLGRGVNATLTTPGKILFNHNGFDNPGTTDYYSYMLYAAGGFVTANYNFGDYTSGHALTGVTDQQGNNKNDIVYEDKGNPDPYYNDVDGTRADVSYEGGLYPYSSFSRSGRIADATLRKPLVMWVEAPRKIRPGQTIEIKATGIAF